MKKKVYPSLDEVVADVPDGARIMFGGFGGAGFPNNLIQALVRKGVKNITAISNNCGTRDQDELRSSYRSRLHDAAPKAQAGAGHYCAYENAWTKRQLWLSASTLRRARGAALTSAFLEL